MTILLHMPKEITKEEQVLDLARKAKILRVQELSEKGIHPEHLRPSLSTRPAGANG